MEKQGSQRQEYIARINRVIDYIDNNLAQELVLDQLAQVANFSRFHFHRIFRAMVGETLNQFIQRVRLEKAASQLTTQPEKSITEIALDCGFSGSATFARAFKDKFQMSASEWKTGGKERNSKNRKTESNNRQTPSKERKASNNSIGYYQDITSYKFDPITKNQIWSLKMSQTEQIKVEVKDIPTFHVAYVRHIGPYKGDGNLFGGLFEKLGRWAGPRGLMGPDTQFMTFYHDDPNITEEEKLRISVSLSVPEDTEVDGEIGKMEIPGGKYAVTRFELDESEYEAAWTAVMGGWLPESGYQPDDRLSYEVCHNSPSEHPEGKHIVDICVPVKPL